MRRNWTVLWQPDETALTAWIQRLPGHAVRRGPVALIGDAGPIETVDAKAVGIFDGVVFNHRQVAQPLIGRGAPIADDASLVLHAVGWSGQQGLGALRWHGTLAVLHQAQRTAIVARDWQGVGGLYWTPLGLGQLFANNAESLRVLGLTPRLVPPGMAAICGPAGVQWQPLATQQDGRAWFRALPDELDAPTPEIWQAGLARRLAEAVAACQREMPLLLRTQPLDRAGVWLTAHVPLAPAAQPDALWSLDGADAWLGLTDVQPLEPQPGPWPLPEPPEPLRVDDREVQARRVRATWLADVALERARSQAAALELPLVVPHLDPAILAWLGAMPPALRPLA